MQRRSIFKAAFASFLAVFSKPILAWPGMSVVPAEKFIVYLNSWDIKETEYVVTSENGWTMVKLKQPRSLKKGEYLTISVHTLTAEGFFSKLTRSCTYFADRDCVANVGVMWQKDVVVGNLEATPTKRSYWV